MNEIICPHCNKAFKIDEAGFADIVRQVRDHQFEHELKTRLALADREKESAVKLAEAQVRQTLQENLAKKDREISELKAQSEVALAEKINQKEAEILKLKSFIDNVEIQKQLAVNEAVQKIEKERDALTHEFTETTLQYGTSEQGSHHQI